MIRINKFLAQNNVASRRKSDDLVADGEVYINNVLAVPGSLVDEAKDIVTVSGQRVLVNTLDSLKYFILNKPANVLSSVSDNRGRTTVTQLVPNEVNVFPVGRLDYLSTGLILLTNDGDLTNKLTHPKFHVPKEYYVKTKTEFTPIQLDAIKNGGLDIEGKKTSKTLIDVISKYELKITLFEGIKRQIRESFKIVGLRVIELKRLSIGELKLGNLKIGDFRDLNTAEMNYINWIKSEK